MTVFLSRLSQTLVWREIAKRGRAVTNGWNSFWFTPADPAPLCLLRILAGGMLFYSHLVWGLDLQGLLGPDGWNSAELIRHMQRDTWSLSFWWLVPTQLYVTAHVVCLIVLALFWLGCWTRVTSVLAFAVHVSYCNRAQLSDYGLDQISGILAMYLMIGPAGSLYSVDSLLRRRRLVQAKLLAGETQIDLSVPPSRSAGLALRLIQFHYCVIYFFSGVSKLQGRSWWTGEAMWRAFANYEYQSTDMTWLAAFPWLLQLMTIVTLLWEISFAYLVWNRHFRPLMLATGLVVHFGIGACLGMWTFALMMMFGYVSFCRPQTVRAVMNILFERCFIWTMKPAILDDTPASINRLAWIKAWDIQDQISLPIDGHHQGPMWSQQPLTVTPVPLIASVPINGMVIESRSATPIASPNVAVDRPVVLYIHPDREAGHRMVQYLKSRGFMATHVTSLDAAKNALVATTPDLILCNGSIDSAANIERFHADWKESEIPAGLCYVLNPSLARGLKPLFESAWCSVLESPVSYREIRIRLVELMAVASCEIPGRATAANSRFFQHPMMQDAWK